MHAAKEAFLDGPNPRRSLSNKVSSAGYVLQPSLRPESSARIDKRRTVEYQAQVPSKASTELQVNKYLDTRFRKAQNTITEETSQNTSDEPNDTAFSHVNWPKPPQSRPSSKTQQSNEILLADEENLPNDAFYLRRQKTDSLKRHHLQKARTHAEKSGVTQRYSSPVQSHHVVELSSASNKCAVPFQNLQNQSVDGELKDADSFSSQNLVPKKRSTLSFSSARTAAEIRPASEASHHDQRIVSGGTIYRSYSAQMSLGKSIDQSQSLVEFDNTERGLDSEGLDAEHEIARNQASLSPSEPPCCLESVDASFEEDLDSNREADDLMEVMYAMGRDIEDRLDERIKQELECRFASILQRMDLLEVIATGAWDALHPETLEAHDEERAVEKQERRNKKQPRGSDSTTQEMVERKK